MPTCNNYGIVILLYIVWNTKCTWFNSGKNQDQPAAGPLYDNNPKPRSLTVGINLPLTVFKFCGVSESAGGLSDTHSGSACLVGCALPPGGPSAPRWMSAWMQGSQCLCPVGHKEEHRSWTWNFRKVAFVRLRFGCLNLTLHMGRWDKVNLRIL